MAELPIPKDHFSLHAEIKALCRFSLHEIYNTDTFDEEAHKSQPLRKRYYISSLITLICLAVFFIVSLYFLSLILGPDKNLLSGDARSLYVTRRNFSLFILFVFGSAAIYAAWKARQDRKLAKENERKRLTAKAQRPALADFIYEALYTILENKIPVSTKQIGILKQTLKLHTWYGRPKQNAMLVLLGGRAYRQILWSDEAVPAGDIVIRNKYYDQILGDLRATIIDDDRATKDNRDGRAYITALRNKQHMQACVREMESKAYWLGRKKKKAISKIIKLAKTLILYWDQWEDMRQNISSAFTESVYEENRNQDLKQKLKEIYPSEAAKLFDVLEGKDRTARSFFRSLRAISAKNLVPAGTTLTSNISENSLP